MSIGTNPQPSAPANLDLYSPVEMTRRATAVGIAKAGSPSRRTLVLAVLAGAFIALGAEFAAIVTTGSQIGYGPTKLLAGIAFSVGLALVVITGAELFTGNVLIVVAWASGKVTAPRLLRNWLLVYIGNLAGSLLIVALVYFGRVWSFDNYEVGKLAIATAVAKTNLGFPQAVALGTLCNLLVCLAVWLTYSARTTTDKLLAVVPPVAAFVASSFEHSVANMYTIPLGLLLKGEPEVVARTGGLISLDSLTIERFLLGNLVPVTIGNILGGAVMVGLAYWLAFRPQLDTDRRIPPSSGAEAGEGVNR